MKRISSIITALLLCFFMGAKAENVVTISSVEGAPGTEVTVSIGLQNSDEISTLQVSIPLDENVTFVEESGAKGSRCSGHAMNMGVKDGELNIVIYSLLMLPISGTSGEVASFRLKLGNQPAAPMLTPSKTVLTSPAGQPVDATVQSGEVIVRCAKAQYSTMEVDFGAVPIRSTYTESVTVTNVGNADLTISSLVFSDVNVFSTSTTTPLTVTPGESKELNITYAPVERGDISRTLKVECNSVSKLNTIRLLAQPFAVNELHIQDVSGISDEEVTITMTMNNMDDVSGYQVDFELPAQLEFVANSFVLSDRKDDHLCGVSHNGQNLRLLVYSPSDKPLKGHDGEIGSFRVKLVGRDGITLTPVKTVLSATINNKVDNVVSAVYGGYIDIRYPYINTSDELDFGAVSVTEACEKLLTISNSGSAPLTVSRIVFNSEMLSIKESLPLTIDPWSSSDVTVVYNSVEQKPFEATMHIYSNDPDQRMRDVKVKGSRYAPNFLTFETHDVLSEHHLAIVVSADTYDRIEALQFDVEYPASQYEPYDGNYTLESRVAGMTVTSRQIDDHTLRYVCYFLGGGSIEPGDGPIMTLLLRPKASLTEGNYQLEFKNIKMGTADMLDKYAGSDQQVTFEVFSGIKGDANNDGSVTFADAVAVVNYILGNPSVSFNIAKADVNGDTKVTITDAVSIVNIILNQ